MPVPLTERERYQAGQTAQLIQEDNQEEESTKVESEELSRRQKLARFIDNLTTPKGT